MGQLIKLHDYISRYEQNIFSYPSRYVRLKKRQWEKTKIAWVNKEKPFTKDRIHSQEEAFEWIPNEKRTLMRKIKGFLKAEKKETENTGTFIYTKEKIRGDEPEENGLFQFQPVLSPIPDSEAELKQLFLDEIFHFQMNWASSTLTEISFVNREYFYEERLKYFLQRFPDTFLILYEPVFLLKKAPVQTETILITPTAVWCISFLEAEDGSVFIGSKERFWIKRINNNEKKVLNPLLALNRTEKIVKRIFQMFEVNLPVYKAVLCRNGYIDYSVIPFDIRIVEKRNYDQWFNTMRELRSPLKHEQLKGAQALLQYCQTVSIKRPEWDPDYAEDEN